VNLGYVIIAAAPPFYVEKKSLIMACFIILHSYWCML